MQKTQLERKVDDALSGTKSALKYGMLGGIVGGLAGAVGGVFLGENLNDYVDTLKQAPAAVRYAVDAGCVIGVGSLGASVGAFLGQLPGLYKIFK